MMHLNTSMTWNQTNFGFNPFWYFKMRENKREKEREKVAS